MYLGGNFLFVRCLECSNSIDACSWPQMLHLEIKYICNLFFQFFNEVKLLYAISFTPDSPLQKKGHVNSTALYNIYYINYSGIKRFL